jgi:hypothetical protein
VAVRVGALTALLALTLTATTCTRTPVVLGLSERDDGSTVGVPAGTRIALALSGEYRWTVQTSDERIATIGGPSGEADRITWRIDTRQKGSASISADGVPNCRFATPPCSEPDKTFRLSVQVQ